MGKKFIIGGSVVLTLLLWLGSKWYYHDWFADPYKYVAKTASLSATILLCWSFILAARLHFFENIFGGLDQIYHIHKIVGRTAFWIILIHPLFLACNLDCSIWETVDYFRFRHDLGFDLGLVAMIVLIVLMGLAVAYFLPYHVWKSIHSFFGLFFLLSIFHIIFIDKDIGKYPLLGIWFYSWVIFAAACYIYIRFLYRYIGPRFPYKVESLVFNEGVIELWLAPMAKKMHYHPGQFVYLNGHPFSIASLANPEGRIRLGIKRVGGFTEKLASLKEGDPVTLFGPYGTFADRFLLANKESIFVGAGIGITPFVSMWEMALVFHRIPKVDLFYIDDHDASFDNHIKDIAICSQYKGHPRLQERGHTYELYKGRITAQYIADKVESFEGKNIFLCGPLSFRKEMVKQLKKLGVRYYQIVTEDFELRS